MTKQARREHPIEDGAGAQAVTAVAPQAEHADVDPDVRLLLLGQSGGYQR